MTSKSLSSVSDHPLSLSIDEAWYYVSMPSALTNKSLSISFLGEKLDEEPVGECDAEDREDVHFLLKRYASMFQSVISLHILVSISRFFQILLSKEIDSERNSQYNADRGSESCVLTLNVHLILKRFHVDSLNPRHSIRSLFINFLIRTHFPTNKDMDVEPEKEKYFHR